MTIKMGARLVTAGLDAALDKFAEHVKTGVIRAGTQAAAQQFYEAARREVPEKSGALKSAIYQVYSKDNSGKGQATYHVSWNRSKAPHGHLIEFGTSRAPAHPFLRPAYESVKYSAGDAARQKMKEILS